MPDLSVRPTRAPGPRGLALLGCLAGMSRDRIGLVERLAAAHGDLAEIRIGRRRLYLVSHPDLARYVLCDRPENYEKGPGLIEARPLLGDGLLTGGGAAWSDQRRRLQPAFQGNRTEAFARSVLHAAATTIARWERLDPTTGPIDLDREMVRLTLAALGASVFGGTLPRDPDAISANLRTVDRWAMRRMVVPLPAPLGLLTPSDRAVRVALRELEALAAEVLRRVAPGGAEALGPFLQGIAGDGPVGEPARALRARDEFLTFLLAGHETIAAALCWTWHLLARNPEAEGHLYDELDEVLDGRDPVPADLPRLRYTRMVVQEVMRLYPPVWMISRRALGDDRLGGYRIPAGSSVLICAYTIHRLAGFWPEPGRFEPSRFADAAERRHPCSYLAFGAGPRSCIGAHPGILEATLAVAALARRFRLRPEPGCAVEPEASLTLRPRRGLWMRPVARPASGEPKNASWVGEPAACHEPRRIP